VSAKPVSPTDNNIWTQQRESRRKLENLHNEGLHNFYSSPNIAGMNKVRWRTWSLVKPKRKAEANITDLKELRCEDADWIHFSHDTVLHWASLNTILTFNAA
jgi:hypothetical protein